MLANKPSKLLWWVCIVVVLCFGAALNFTGYDYGLPYIENVDEGFILTETYALRGLYGDGSRMIPGYPPFIVWIYQGSQFLVEGITGDSAIQHPAQVVKYVRLAAAFTNVLTILVIGLTARHIGGGLAGVLAATAWAVMPNITENTLVGLTEAWQVFWITLSLYFTFLALEKDSPRWAVISVVAGLVAILFKYSAYPVLGLGVGVTLWGMYSNWRRWSKPLVVQIVAIALCAVALLAYGATELVAAERPEATTFLQKGFSNVLNFQYGTRMFITALNLVGMTIAPFVLIFSLGTVFFWRRHTPSRRVGWILMAGLPLSIAWLVTTYLVISALGDRYTTPATSCLIIIISVSITQIAVWLGYRFKSQFVTMGVAASLAIYWLAPQFQTAINAAYIRTLPSTMASLVSWSDEALEQGTIHVSRENWRMFDATWGGSTGPARPWVNEPKLTERTLDEWAEIYVVYAQLNEEDLFEIRETPEGRAYLDQLLFLKRFPPEDERDEWRGPTMYVYRLKPIQHPLDVTFGEQIRLIGYDLSASEVVLGDTLDLSPYWQALTQPATNYNAYVHLVPLDSREIISQSDGPPALETYPTSRWNDPQEIILGREFQLQIPADIVPGEYRVVVGLYELSSGQRLLTDNELDFALIETITVKP